MKLKHVMSESVSESESESDLMHVVVLGAIHAKTLLVAHRAVVLTVVCIACLLLKILTTGHPLRRCVC